MSEERDERDGGGAERRPRRGGPRRPDGAPRDSRDRRGEGRREPGDTSGRAAGRPRRDGWPGGSPSGRSGPGGNRGGRFQKPGGASRPGRFDEGRDDAGAGRGGPRGSRPYGRPKPFRTDGESYGQKRFPRRDGRPGDGTGRDEPRGGRPAGGPFRREDAGGGRRDESRRAYPRAGRGYPRGDDGRDQGGRGAGSGAGARRPGRFERSGDGGRGAPGSDPRRGQGRYQEGRYQDRDDDRGAWGGRRSARFARRDDGRDGRDSGTGRRGPYSGRDDGRDRRDSDAGRRGAYRSRDDERRGYRAPGERGTDRGPRRFGESDDRRGPASAGRGERYRPRDDYRDRRPGRDDVRPSTARDGEWRRDDRPRAAGRDPRSGGRPGGSPYRGDRRDEGGRGTTGGGTYGRGPGGPRRRPDGAGGGSWRRDDARGRDGDQAGAARPAGGGRGSQHREGRRPFDRDDRRSQAADRRPRREPGPPIPEEVTGEELDRAARAELRTLPKDLAADVARHLVMAGRLVDDDPDQAYQHAAAARGRAARVGVVREACGLAAYHAGQWSVALSELRAARRLSGQEAYLAIMADCERGLGRPERALDLARSEEARRLPPADTVEMRIVEAGARRDLGQFEAAVLALRVPELKDERLRPWSARLFYAYADALVAASREEEAADWFAKAAAADREGETDAAERYAEIEGLEIIDTEDDDLEDELDGEVGDQGAREADDRPDGRADGRADDRADGRADDRPDGQADDRAGGRGDEAERDED